MRTHLMDNDDREGAFARGPLDGVRILDLTGTMSGPFCTLLLAQLGASVDKVEPAAGDVVRHLTAGREPAMSPIFLALNAGKQSVVLDLREPAERERLRRALPGYDVVVHNMRPQAAERLGLTAEGLKDAGSDAVLCELVGFGPGPYATRPAYDDTIQAMSGVAWVQGNGGEPEYVRTAIADKTAGMYAALAICAELTSRRRGGSPRVVRVPMFEAMVSFITAEQLGGMTFEPPTGPALYPRTASPYRRPFRTSDGYVSLMLYTDAHWSAFLRSTGHADLIDDVRFATLGGRTANIDEIYALVADELTLRGTTEWLELLEEMDVPHAPVNSLEDLLDDPHLRDQEVFAETDHPTQGRIRTVRAPFLFDGRRTRDLSPAPTLGEHTESVTSTWAGRVAPEGATERELAPEGA
jgi:crotonobetainyl-CoA:carnitine CoA-transferase CaiB-like acyl-CoA transferase